MDKYEILKKLSKLISDESIKASSTYKFVFVMTLCDLAEHYYSSRSEDGQELTIDELTRTWLSHYWPLRKPYFPNYSLKQGSTRTIVEVLQEEYRTEQRWDAVTHNRPLFAKLKKAIRMPWGHLQSMEDPFLYTVKRRYKWRGGFGAAQDSTLHLSRPVLEVLAEFKPTLYQICRIAWSQQTLRFNRQAPSPIHWSQLNVFLANGDVGRETKVFKDAWFEVLPAREQRCLYCRTPLKPGRGTEGEHFICRSGGPRTHIGLNVVLSCIACNRKTGGKFEYLPSKRHLGSWMALLRNFGSEYERALAQRNAQYDPEDFMSTVHSIYSLHEGPVWDGRKKEDGRWRANMVALDADWKHLMETK